MSNDRSRAQVKTGEARAGRQRVASTPTATERALAALLAGPRGCSEVGSMVWDHAGHQRRGRVSSVNGGGDYAAQMLLGRMRKAGLVRTTHDEGSSRWELTAEGRKRIAAMEPSA